MIEGTPFFPDEKNGYFFARGRVALYALLKAMGVGEGHTVVLPAFTCIAVPNAISYLGARPAYADINPETFNIDPEQAEQAIIDEKKKAKVIIAQHTFGIPADMDGILDIAARHGLYVIEDACHAIGSMYKGRMAGGFGDAAFFSSQWSKPVTTGLGGWAVVNNGALRKNLDEIRRRFQGPSAAEALALRVQYHAYSLLFRPSTSGFMRDTYRALTRLGLVTGSSSHAELEENKKPRGYEKTMSAWQKRLLMGKLADIGEVIEHRKKIAAVYEGRIGKYGLRAARQPAGFDAVYLRFPAIVDDKPKTLSEARRRKMDIGDWFISPVHPNLEGWEKAGYRRGSCPVAEDACRHVINLPTHPGVGAEEAERISDFIIGG